MDEELGLTSEGKILRSAACLTLSGTNGLASDTSLIQSDDQLPFGSAGVTTHR